MADFMVYIKVIFWWTFSLISIIVLIVLHPVFYPIYWIQRRRGKIKPRNKIYTDYRYFVAPGYDSKCTTCSFKDIKKFPASWDYENFEIWFRKANFSLWGRVNGMTSGPDWKFGFVQYGNVTNFYGAHIYKCNSCNSLWELSSPDYSWRGYFRRIELKPTIPEDIIKKV